MIGNMKSSTLESIQAIPSPKTSVVDSGGTIPEKKTTEDDLS
jgi:hypothetical protein